MTHSYPDSVGSPGAGHGEPAIARRSSGNADEAGGSAATPVPMSAVLDRLREAAAAHDEDRRHR